MKKIDYNGSTNFNRDLVFKNINKLGDYLYKSNGLNLNKIILEIFENFKEYEYVSQESVNSFNETVNLLREINYENLDYILSKKLPRGIEKEKIIKENGHWHLVNKLNTNSSDLSFMLTDLIYKMMNDEEKVKKYIYPIYVKIINNKSKTGLNKIKDRLKNIIIYYFIKKGNGLEDLKKYTKYSKINSKKGELSEKIVSGFLKDKKFEILFEGGDGDFIDMKFGIDLIVYRKDIGHKTIQVKSYKPQKKNIDYYNVDWIIYTEKVNNLESVIILDKRLFTEVVV